MSMFIGFKVESFGLSATHLQYDDDTLYIGNTIVENLWAIKNILRCFEHSSGLRFNFAKSFIMGVSVDVFFLGLAANFLHCSIALILFKYLGLPVRDNYIRLSTWKPLLDSLVTRLSSWSNRFVSLDGRVIVLNSVLNYIQIFFPFLSEKAKLCFETNCEKFDLFL